MTYLVTEGEQTLELSGEAAVVEALERGVITPESWIKIEDVESDWQTVSEMFPDLGR